MLAHPARLGRRLAPPSGADAIERARDDAGRGRLADAADAGQQERVGDPTGAHGIGKGPDQRFLTDQLGKFLRPIGSGQHPIVAADLLACGLRIR